MNNKSRRRPKRQPIEVEVGDLIYRCILGYSQGQDFDLDIDHMKESRGKLAFKVNRASSVPRALFSDERDPLVSQSLSSRGIVAICTTKKIPPGTMIFKVVKVKETVLEVKPVISEGEYLYEYLGGTKPKLMQNKVFNGLDIPKSLMKSVSAGGVE